jgi:hypothetical protein
MIDIKQSIFGKFDNLSGFNDGPVAAWGKRNISYREPSLRGDALCEGKTDMYKTGIDAKIKL